MSSKISSFEEKVKLPPTETISRCYQPQGNRNRIIRILTVAVYVLCVSLAAIMLSLYYIFIWDPNIRPFVTKGSNCEKIVIPERIAIRLINSSEVTAEQFYRHILEQYRILNQLQIQRQQFLQKQHHQLQQLAASSRFQEIFATATIIQANPNDRILKPITPTNGTFLLDRSIPLKTTSAAPPLLSKSISANPSETERLPILGAIPVQTTRRKSHRKHTNHHRHSTRKAHRKSTQSHSIVAEPIKETPLNPPSPAIFTQDVLTSMPIPLILNSKEEVVPQTKYLWDTDRKSTPNSPQLNANSATYRRYLNPLLNGELIFEK